MNEPFEIHRRIGLYVLTAVSCTVVAAGFGWFAYDRSEPLLAAPGVALLVLAAFQLRGVVDPRTPLFVADDHGVRLQSDQGWIGLLWSEMGEIRVERRTGLRHDARVKVISVDGRRIHSTPIGIATDVSPGEAEVQLARRRGAGAY